MTVVVAGGRWVMTMVVSVLLASCGARSALDEQTVDAGVHRRDVGVGDDSTYRLISIFTGVHRFAVEKHDAMRERCTVVVFAVHGGSHESFGLDLPEGWGLESAWRGPCATEVWPGPPAGAARPTGGEGWGAWADDTCAIAVDLTLHFSGAEPERVSADDLMCG